MEEYNLLLIYNTSTQSYKVIKCTDAEVSELQQKLKSQGNETICYTLLRDAQTRCNYLSRALETCETLVEVKNEENTSAKSKMTFQEANQLLDELNSNSPTNEPRAQILRVDLTLFLRMWSRVNINFPQFNAQNALCSNAESSELYVFPTISPNRVFTLKSDNKACCYDTFSFYKLTTDGQITGFENCSHQTDKQWIVNYQIENATTTVTCEVTENLKQVAYIGLEASHNVTKIFQFYCQLPVALCSILSEEFNPRWF